MRKAKAKKVGRPRKKQKRQKALVASLHFSWTGKRWSWFSTTFTPPLNVNPELK